MSKKKTEETAAEDQFPFKSKCNNCGVQYASKEPQQVCFDCGVKLDESNKPKSLTSAILQVMDECKSVEKGLTVGAGKNSYKGVSDKDVKQLIQPALVRAGLVIIPISVDPVVKIERWEENTNYGVKQKQQILTETKVTFELIHESGESRQIVGYGHGIDSQDKSAGKAMTYALKYALLYTFMIPTGAIDDADTDHSDNKPVPAQNKPKQTLNDEQFKRALEAIENGQYTKGELISAYALNEEQIKTITNNSKS
jgi:hypothetical protein